MHGGSDGKASAYNAGDPVSIPGLGRSPGEGNGNPLQNDSKKINSDIYAPKKRLNKIQWKPCIYREICSFRCIYYKRRKAENQWANHLF